MADLRCSRTRLPIPGRYEQRVVQLTDVVRSQEPPDYVTQLHTVGAGVYCSTTCAVLHMAESVVLDGDALADLPGHVAADLLSHHTPCQEALAERERRADVDAF